MNSKQLELFFAERPALNKTVFAEECGITRQYLLMILSGKRPLTDKTAEKLKPVMERYGW